MNYEDLNLSPEVVRAVREMGFAEMTEIQQKAIPLLLENKELIAKAPTGTGKTCAFGLPLIEAVDEDADYPQALVLCPTRELCTQIRDDLRSFAKHKPKIKVVALYGGQPIPKQLTQLKQGPQILVATPGRLTDHIKHRAVSLKQVTRAVLDEADEMLDMGFYKDVQWLLDQLPKGKFRLSMFSATISRPVMDIGWLYQRDPEEIIVEPVFENKPDIGQYAIKSAGTRKINELCEIIQKLNFHRNMIFCNTKYQTESLCRQMVGRGLSAKCINGDMLQKERNQIMNEYKDGGFENLVVTDVAARGIDVTGVDAVFNFDVPLENEYYLHRIGRTGRAKQSGVAYTFWSDGDSRHFNDIIRYTRSEVKFLKFDENRELVPE